MKTTDQPIVVVEYFNCSSDEVWSAITKLEHMHKWFFDNIPEFKAEPGFKTAFDVQSTERVFPHVWEVREVIPNEKLTVNWTFTGYPGSSNIIFELAEADQQVKLTLTAVVLEEFPTDIPEFKRESGEAGWKYFIQGKLKKYIEKG